MKSHASDLVGLLGSVYKDAASKCATVVDQRDLQTMQSRVEHEGLSFLTITLPSFCHDFERSLANGGIEPDLFLGFKKRLGTPAFLQGFLALVFDQTGRLLHEPAIEAVEAVRQITGIFRKLNVACSANRTRAAFGQFKQCERVLQETSVVASDFLFYRRVANTLWKPVLSILSVESAIPKHGPGATCESISGNRKYRHKSWYDRLEPYFPLLGTAFSVTAADSNEFEMVSAVSEDQELPVRVITVPKTLKGPRIIAIEPVCMQYTQQALKTLLVERLESAWITKGHINFASQHVNRSLALTSSSSGQYATLDLSAASDRVEHELALCMFETHPDLSEAIQACRSKVAKLPDGELITLKKFASMGSALCFPVESMFFYTLCVMALLRRYDLPVTPWNCYKVSRDVYVYGDDIVVPVDTVDVVIDTLHRFKCKVNDRKSFWTGKFRESCGMDAYDGHEVTPTYVRHLLPDDRRSPKALISLIEASNHFYKRGYWHTSTHILNRCESILGKLPIVGDNCSGLGKVSFQAHEGIGEIRYNRDTQVNEVLTWVPKSVRYKDELSGYGALQKCLIALESRPPGEISNSDKDHLLSSARHGAVALQRHWVLPW